MTDRTFRSTIPALLAGAIGFGAASALGAEPSSTQDLQAQIRDLQTKVAQLQAQQPAPAAAPALNAHDVDATIAAVLADAERRSQLLAESGSFLAGFEKGKFLLQTADKAFVFHPWLQFQLRNATLARDKFAGGSDYDVQNGFEVRRMKLGFDGNLFSKDLTYLFSWAGNRSGGGLALEEAWIKYAFAESFALRAGQMKDPVMHEGLTSSKRLLASERSYLENRLGNGDNFIQGVALIYAHGKLQSEVAFTDGSGSANTNFEDRPTNGTDFGVAGRVQYAVMGDWKSYEDFSALGTKDRLFVVGGGADWTQSGDSGVLQYTADAQYETPGGLGAYGAFIGRFSSNAAAAAGADMNDWGAMGQVAYLVPNTQWEPFVRYDFTHFDGKQYAPAVENDVHEITVGANYYFQGHSAKLTLDGSWLPNGVPANQADGGADILANPGNNIFVLRVQFQLLI